MGAAQSELGRRKIASSKIAIVEGGLADQKVDVIVNSCNPALLLKEGGISRRLVQVAGTGLEKECSEKYPDGIGFGEVAVTGGHLLSCKKVYHTALPTWDSEFVDALQVLKTAVTACLTKAEEEKMQSIAFPALGCGFLNYPHDVVARAMHECMLEHEKSSKSSTIRRIFVCIWPKGSDWKHIKAAFIQEASKQRSSLRTALPEESEAEQSSSLQTVHPEESEEGQMSSLRTVQLEESEAKQRSSCVLPEVSEAGAVAGSAESVQHKKNIKQDFLSTCIRETSSNACKKVLGCGHICCGYRKEPVCLPCIQPECAAENQNQTAEDDCTICYTDNLGAAPVAQLGCGHIFHLHCLKRILENRWVGPKINFYFTKCPVCKETMVHPELDKLMDPIKALEEEVRHKALMRLEYDKLTDCKEVTRPSSKYYRNPAQYAMDRYIYYTCFRCKQVFFGGTARDGCGAEDTQFNPSDLKCPSCRGKIRKDKNSDAEVVKKVHARQNEEASKVIKEISKACPHCGVRTEKNGGCMHMTCARCHMDWCWLCEKEWCRKCQATHWFGEGRGDMYNNFMDEEETVLQRILRRRLGFLGNAEEEDDNDEIEFLPQRRNPWHGPPRPPTPPRPRLF